MGYSKLLHSVWLKLHPTSQETEVSLAAVLRVANSPPTPSPRKGGRRPAAAAAAPAPAPLEPVAPAPPPPAPERWTPKHSKLLRELVAELRAGGQFRRSHLLQEWRRRSKSRQGAQELGRRLEDLLLPLPQDWGLVQVQARIKEQQEQEVVVVQEKVQEVAKETGSGLNARGQMRWTQQAVSDLLACHKLGLEAKSVSGSGSKSRSRSGSRSWITSSLPRPSQTADWPSWSTQSSCSATPTVP